MPHTRLNQLLKRIKDHYNDKQIIISTQSFVSNKLGLDNLILLNQLQTVRFKDLKSKSFFIGYDTLSQKKHILMLESKLWIILPML